MDLPIQWLEWQR